MAKVISNGWGRGVPEALRGQAGAGVEHMGHRLQSLAVRRDTINNSELERSHAKPEPLVS